MTESIFRGVVTNENAFTQLLCNLMKRDSELCKAVVSLLCGREEAIAGDIAISTQKRLPRGCGQPDISIESDELCLIVEVKTDSHRTRTRKQEFGSDHNYLSYLQSQYNASRRVCLAYLVPHKWKFRKEMSDGIAGLRKIADATNVTVKQVFWEDILQLLFGTHLRQGIAITEEFRLLLTEHFGPISFEREETSLMFSPEFPIRTLLKLNAVLEGLRQKAGAHVATKLYSDKDESGFYLQVGKRSLLFVGCWLAFWDAGHHYPLCFGVQDESSHIRDAFQLAFREVYKQEAISFDDWWMGWVSEEDLVGVDAVDEIWAKLEPIWNKVKAAIEESEER